LPSSPVFNRFCFFTHNTNEKQKERNNENAFDDESAAVGNDQDVFVRDWFFGKKRRRRRKSA
jgi:hypothetical protein